MIRDGWMRNFMISSLGNNVGRRSTPKIKSKSIFITSNRFVHAYGGRFELSPKCTTIGISTLPILFTILVRSAIARYCGSLCVGRLIRNRYFCTSLSDILLNCAPVSLSNLCCPGNTGEVTDISCVPPSAIAATYATSTQVRTKFIAGTSVGHSYERCPGC